MITKIKGKTWRIAQDVYHWQTLINKKSKLYYSSHLPVALLDLSEHLKTLNVNTSFADGSLTNSARTVLKQDFWRIAKQDNLYFVQTRTNNTCSWNSLTDGIVLIGVYDNPEAALLKIIEWLTT